MSLSLSVQFMVQLGSFARPGLFRCRQKSDSRGETLEPLGPFRGASCSHGYGREVPNGVGWQSPEDLGGTISGVPRATDRPELTCVRAMDYIMSFPMSSGRCSSFIHSFIHSSKIHRKLGTLIIVEAIKQHVFLWESSMYWVNLSFAALRR